MSTETPAQPVAPQPAPIPAPELKYHYVIVPEAEGSPVAVSCSTLAEMCKQLHSDLLRHAKGWCFAFAEGKRVKISMPRQQFKLAGDGISADIGGEDAVAFSEDGSFRVLK